PLDADAVRDLADGERRPRPLGHPADADAFERLQPRLFTLADLRPHLDGVAGAELGELGFAALALVDGVENPLAAHKGVPGEKHPTGRGVLPEIDRYRQVERPNSRSSRMAAALRTDRWFQSDAPSIGASTRDAPGISPARPQPVPSRSSSGRGSKAISATRAAAGRRGPAGEAAALGD